MFRLCLLYTSCNPVLTQKDLPEGFSKFDFRDPKIWREADGTYSVVTVCLAEYGSGAAALFQSCLLYTSRCV